MRIDDRHGRETGGGWSGFPPLLATTGRTKRGDCEMRTGAIFARGSCRALTWMALVGMVFALGVGQAAAQIKVSDPKTVNEGSRLTITVTADVRVTGQVAASTLTVNVAAAPGALNESKMLTPAENTSPDIDYVAPPTEVELAVPARTDANGYTEHKLTHTLIVQTNGDPDAEDEAVVFTFTPVQPVAGVGPKGGGANTTWSTDAITRNVTINDTDDQDFIWKVKSPAKPNEGDDIMVELKAMPAPVELTYTTALSVNTMGYELDPTSHTFGPDATQEGDDGPTALLEITPPNPDKNRDMDTIMVNAFVAGTASTRVPALKIEVADIHMLPMADKISAKAYTDDGKGKPSKTETKSVMEGGDPVHVTVTVDRGTSGYPMEEKLEVSLMGGGSQAADYRVDPAMVEIADGTGEKSATFKLWALKDDDVGAEDLMLTLTAMGAKDDNGSGEVKAMFSIAIEDDTTAKVWAKDGAMKAVYDARDEAAGDDKKINPGENFEIMTDDLFGHLPTVTVGYAASSDNSAVGVSASGEKVMVMPQDMAGTAKITITATATDKASSFKTSQTRSDVAQIMFEVDVMLAALSYTIKGPEDMNLVEGGDSAMVMVMASRPLDGDETAKVMLMRDGSSSASMDDFTVMPEMVTLGAGDEMAEFMVMATADDMMENDGNMTEMLTLFAVVNDMQMSDQSVMFYIWDEAVPALPVIAQLLLAAFLAIGGYRRYLRR